MQPINFVKIASLKKHKEVRHWFYVSVCFGLLSALAVSALHIKRWQAYHVLQLQKNNHFAQLQTLQNLINQHKLIQTQYTACLHNGSHSDSVLKNPSHLLKHIKTSLGANAQLESVTFLQDQTIEVKILAQNTPLLLQTVDTLAQQPIGADLCLVSLEQKDAQKILGVLKTQAPLESA